MMEMRGALPAGVREAPNYEIAGGRQGGAAAYGDSTIAVLAAVCILSLSALRACFLRRIWRG